MIIRIYLASILLAALAFSVVESKSLIDAIWWCFVTSLTIGYGDIAPVTIAGRIVGIVFGHFWVFCIIPMIVANILMKAIRDDHAFTDAEQEQLKKDVAEILKLVKQDQGDLK
jgi:hypothetical protein